MERNFIFTFVLLVTLSIVNADFRQCGPIAPDTTSLPALKVAENPDPLAPGKATEFTITDAAGKAPTTGKITVVYADRNNNIVGTPKTYPAGGKIMDNVSADLPKEYRCTLVLADDAGKNTGCAVEDGIAAAADAAKTADPAAFRQCGPIAPDTTPLPALKAAVNPDPLIPGKATEFTITDADGKVPTAGKITVLYGDRNNNKAVGTPKTYPVGEKITDNVPADLPKEYRCVLVLADDAGKNTGCAVKDGIAAAAGAAKAADPAAFRQCGPIAPDTTPLPALKAAVNPDPLTPGKATEFTITDAAGKAPTAGKITVLYIDRNNNKRVGTPKTYPAGEKITDNVPADLPKEYRCTLILADNAGKNTGCAVKDGIAAAADAGDVPREDF